MRTVRRPLGAEHAQTQALAETPVAGTPQGAVGAPLQGAVGNRAFSAIVARSGGLAGDGAVNPDVRAAIASAQGGGRPLDPGLAKDLEPGFGEPLADVRVHTGDDADALTRSVQARAFAVGRDVWFAEGEYQPGTESGRRLVAHEVAHAVQQGPAAVPADLQVTNPGDAVENEAEHMAEAALTPQQPVVARWTNPSLARGPGAGAKASVLAGIEKIRARFTFQNLEKRQEFFEKADNLTSALQGPPAVAQLGQTLSAGANGMSTLTLPARAMSQTSQDNLKQIVQFALIDAYCTRFVQVHADDADLPPAPAVTPGGGTQASPPAPAPPPAPKPAPSGGDLPTGGPTADAIDGALLESIGIGVQSELEGAWRKGAWPEGHEYTWSESGDSSTDAGYEKDGVGVTGSIAFSNLTGQTIERAPSLGQSATQLGVTLASPGTLTVRMIMGGTLGRGSTWTNSWWDNLAVNAGQPVQTEEGPGRSVALQIGTNWLWDDNQTVWDFVVTVNADGTPRVEDAKSGTPDDSKLFGWGEGGTHTNITPTLGGAQNPKAARAIRSGPVVARAIPAAVTAAFGAAIEFLGSDLAAAIAGGMQAVGSGVGTVAGAFQHGQNGCAQLTLPQNVMSSKDNLKLKQILQYRIVNAYSTKYLEKHPELRPAAAGTPPITPAPAPAPKGGTPPAKAGDQPAPAAPSGPTGAPTASAIDSAIAEAVKNQVAIEINRAWVRGVAPAKEYVWSESGDSSRDEGFSKDTVGVTGAIAFSQLRGEAIKESPSLNDDARALKLSLPGPGDLVVRRVQGGTLDRSGSWTDSWWDNLAVNMSTPVVAEDGADSSVALHINTDWLWDDNATVWDFVVSVGDDGVPIVEDTKSGSPDDSSWFGYGEGGSHSRVTPTGGDRATDAKPGPQGAAKAN